MMLVLVALGAMMAPAAASASSGQLSILQDDREFLGELPGEDPRIAMDEAKALGVDMIRLNVIFNRIYTTPKDRKKPAGFNTADPSSPKYNWNQIDRAVSLARGRKIKLLLTVTGPGPFWSTEKPSKCKANPCPYRPKPKDFGQFAAAVAKRYKGKVSLYSIYNEPNLGKTWLTPRYGKKTKQGKVDVAAAIYRKLFIYGQRSIAKYDRGARNKVLFGETSAISNPLPFLNAALCLDSKGRPFKGSRKKLQGCSKAKRLNIGGFAIHPYNQGGNGTSRSKTRAKGALPVAYLPRLHRLSDRAKRRGRINRKSIYNTEFGFQTKPPDPFGASPLKQALYLNESDRLQYSDSRVKGIAQYELVDPKERKQFNSGLRFVRGKGGNKPSYAAYKMPIVVTKRSSRSVEVWGQVRPGGRATVAIQVASGGKWKTVKRSRTNGRGYFRTNVKRKGASRLKWRTQATVAGQGTLTSRKAKAGKRIRFYRN